MKALWTLLSAAMIAACVVLLAGGAPSEPPAGEVLGPDPVPETIPLAVVRHRWQVKIAQSNHVAIRPGSVYDIVTYFEQNAGLPRPRFNYLFLDLGLGAADPLYPVFQRGRQASWTQLLPAMLSDRNRHIDHASTIDTPEGCRVHSTYWVRHIDEFPDRYRAERAAGYTLVDISFNHYEKLRPDAQCGRHLAHARDPSFDAHASIAPYADDLAGLEDVPAALLERYEAKIGLLKLVSEEFDRERWPRFTERYAFERNSLWYYPEGIERDYGLTGTHPQGPRLPALRAGQLLYPADETLRAALPLSRTLGTQAFAQLVRFLDGRPVSDFDPAAEPGHDTLSLRDIGTEHYLTAGLEVLPIGSGRALHEHLADPGSFRLVSALARPYQDEPDRRWNGTRVIPQLRLVYQLTAPGDPDTAVEQLFVHLNFDAVDRDAPAGERDAGHRRFLARLAAIAGLDEGSAAWTREIGALLSEHTARPVQNVSFSSSLTGIWIFGALSRAESEDGTLAPLRVVREGVDVGYYSSAYDTVLFRRALERARDAGERPLAGRLRAHLEALTPRSYRDPRRSDPHALSFGRMTCAQCHQMAARDAVHLALNDGLDRRYDAPTRPSEFVLRELDRQLSVGAGYWQGRSSAQGN